MIHAVRQIRNLAPESIRHHLKLTTPELVDNLRLLHDAHDNFELQVAIQHFFELADEDLPGVQASTKSLVRRYRGVALDDRDNDIKNNSKAKSKRTYRGQEFEV